LRDELVELVAPLGVRTRFPRLLLLDLLVAPGSRPGVRRGRRRLGPSESRSHRLQSLLGITRPQHRGVPRCAASPSTAARSQTSATWRLGRRGSGRGGAAGAGGYAGCSGWWWGRWWACAVFHWWLNGLLPLRLFLDQRAGRSPGISRRTRKGRCADAERE